MVDIQLRDILIELNNASVLGRDRAIHEAMTKLKARDAERDKKLAKAYGNCTNCYGKGYATLKSQITGYGTDGDIGGYQGHYKKDLPVQMKYCDCERGKQLQALLANGEQA